MPQRNDRILAVVDDAILRLSWIAFCALLVAATWRSGGIARGLSGVAAGLGVVAVVPNLRESWIRRLRMVAGGWVAICGTVFTLYLSALQAGKKDPTGASLAALIAVLIAVAATWILEDRAARESAREAERMRREDQLHADARHQELLAAVAERAAEARGTRPLPRRRRR